MAESRLFERESLEFARAVTFFDAIFAFSVTLLVTTLVDFRPEAWTSLQTLIDTDGRSLSAFAISFVVVMAFWRVNHTEVTGLTALDGRLIWLQSAQMFGIVLIPFSTEAMGKSSDLPLPVAFYAVDIAATYALHAAVVLVAEQRGWRTARRRFHSLPRRLTGFAVVPAVFLLSIPLAYLFSPSVAQWSWTSLFVLTPLADRLLHGSAEPEDVR